MYLPGHRAHHEPRGGWVGGRGQTKGKATKLDRVKPRGQNCTAMAQLRIAATIIRWQTVDLRVNSDYW